jgi:hypothetical protein
MNAHSSSYAARMDGGSDIGVTPTFGSAVGPYRRRHPFEVANKKPPRGTEVFGRACR